jgi:phospholipase D1/2
MSKGNDSDGEPGRTVLGIAVFLAVLLGLAAIWRLTPLHGLLDVGRLAALGRRLRDHPAGPALVLAVYLVGALVFFPMTFIMAATALVFDPVRGFCYGLVGALAGAALTYGEGHLVKRYRPGWLAGPTALRWRARLERRGVLTMAVVRLVPVGNFSLPNIVAGALPIPFGPYMLGNLLGLVPELLLLNFFAGLFTGLFGGR